MRVQGSRERVLDSVVPHEVTHTVFATHFRQPLPRWADEGACTTVEHDSEIRKQENMLIDFLRTRRGIDFNSMFMMKEYPQDVLPLYAQGHSLARFLIDQKGKRTFLNFLADGMQDEQWHRAIEKHYGYDHLLALQNSWLDWVKAGRPQIRPVDDRTMLASAQAATPPAAPESRDEVSAARASDSVKPAKTQAMAEASGESQGELRSVYGENAAWRPQKRRPIVPVPTGDQQASTGAAAYDASRPHESAWR
jgi:hypothetical protein